MLSEVIQLNKIFPANESSITTSAVIHALLSGQLLFAGKSWRRSFWGWIMKINRADRDRITQRAIQEVMENREEILRAFVAKHGFQPDECEQVQQGSRWCVVRLDPDVVAKVTRGIIIARLGGKRFTWWQQLCLAAAGYGKR